MVTTIEREKRIFGDSYMGISCPFSLFIRPGVCKEYMTIALSQ